MVLANRQGTREPLLSAYLIAQMINRAAGGAVVAPWEVDQLAEEWIDAARALTEELPEMRAGRAQVDEYLAKWRQEFRRKNG